MAKKYSEVVKESKKVPSSQSRRGDTAPVIVKTEKLYYDWRRFQANTGLIENASDFPPSTKSMYFAGSSQGYGGNQQYLA